MKKWIIKKANDTFVDEIVRKTDLSRLCAEVLTARGLNEFDEIVSFFNNDELSDPFLLKDMDTAVEVISESVELGEKICIYGDYDCDGVTATAILFSYLEYYGADVSFFIPERDEGYGLNANAIKKLSDEGVSLIITVDNGISAVDEAELIAALGMKLVITDHHQPPEVLPSALAIINPHQKDCPSPYKNLAGCGVALKLCAALDEGSYEMVLEQYSELAAIGTIADVVSLDGENRYIVKKGLEMLKVTENEGLLNLLKKTGLSQEKITATSVAFSLAPKINAAGRFGSATTAVNALLSVDDDTETFTDQLIKLNDDRKKTEQDILVEIDNSIYKNPEILNQKVLFFSGENWHHGVIGIVCARLMNRYSKPVFVMSVERDEARGSARSFEGFDIYDCLTYCKNSLTRYGGHSAAGGFSTNVDMVEQFRDKIYEFSNQIVENDPIMTITADKLLRAEDFKVELAESLNVLEPFGAANPQPIFAMIGAIVNAIIPLSGGKHTKLDLKYDGVNVSALIFSTSPLMMPFKVGEKCDLLAKLSVNEYKDKKSVNVIVNDFRKNGFSQQKYFAAKAFYEAYRRGTEQPSEVMKKVTPTRDELIYIYKFILSLNTTTTVESIFVSIGNENINFFKLRLCIDILSELGHIILDNVTLLVSVPKQKNKKQLESSKIYNELRCNIDAKQ